MCRQQVTQTQTQTNTIQPGWWRHFLPACVLMLSVFYSVSGFARTAGTYDPESPTSMGSATELPPQLEGIKIDPKVGAKVDSNLEFTNEQGQKVLFGDFFKRGKPVILSLVYYSCPSLCNLHLNGITEVFKEMPWTAGNEFEAVALSFEAKETADLAAQKKLNYLNELGKPGAAKGWHFLTGEAANIKALAEQVGFKYRWDEATQQYAHGSAAIIITPDGVVSRYLNGVVFDSQTMRLALVEASKGQVGTIVDHVMMYCFKFDPNQNKYVFYAFNIMRVGAGLVAILLFGFLLRFWLSTRRRFKEGCSEISSSI